jgi:hypothetical protein
VTNLVTVGWNLVAGKNAYGLMIFKFFLVVEYQLFSKAIPSAFLRQNGRASSGSQDKMSPGN